jgi:small subunit ribosomal protein S8
MTDPIADMLTRIRNGHIARHDQVLMPASRMKLAIARILKDEGFVKDFELVKERDKDKVVPQRTLRIWLRYAGKKQPVITGLKRVSKPGLRVYVKADEMPRVLGGLGTAIVTTPNGVMAARTARHQNVGGEVICLVW